MMGLTTKRSLKLLETLKEKLIVEPHSFHIYGVCAGDGVAYILCDGSWSV